MNTQVIPLAYGGNAPVGDLITIYRGMGLTCLTIGQQAVVLEKHSKPRSLDVVLRRFARNRDTKQAQKSVVHALVATGRFVRASVICPDSGRLCKGVALVH